MLLPLISSSQSRNDQDYRVIRSQYEQAQKNDVRVMYFVNAYIKRARKESNQKQLVQAYRDAVFFSPDNHNKLAYSDSMIVAANHSGDKDLMALAYLGKGIIYYFNYKQFKPALEEYIKAYHYSKYSKDFYLKNKIVYHLGVVKSYLGYYQDSIPHFNSCLTFFESAINKSRDKNELYNNKRGYFNALHQAIVSYRNLGNYKTSDSLINRAFIKIDKEKDFALEKSYFLKCRALSNYKKAKYNLAINDFESALPELLDKDFSWATLVYYYLASSYDLVNENKKALELFHRVDSIYSKHQFILPEIRINYEWLINYYKANNDTKQELYFTNQLLKIDTAMTKNFTYLSAKIHKEYDTDDLLEKKEYLEKQNNRRLYFVIALACLSLTFIGVLMVRRKNEIQTKQRYLVLQQKLDQQPIAIVAGNLENFRKSVLSEELCIELANKLEIFEKNKGFTKKGLSLVDLAAQLKTNSSYLSIFINENKGGNFKNYINRLRIIYITNLMNTNSKYLNYTTIALADEAGFLTRQSFSDLFCEINGLRPNDFVREKKDFLRDKS